ncbi:MAG TPA: hypothetical protein VNS09_12860 [Solirubrobacter sp.]|nr:hypothetical protein [Solirubrobacter sp.]
MGIFLTLIVGLTIWVILTATDLMKSFDAFIIGMVLVLLAVTARLMVPYLPGNRR